MCAEGSIFVGSDAVPEVSKGCVASIFRVKQSCQFVLKACISCRIIGDIVAMPCDSYFLQENGNKITYENTQLFIPITQAHAAAILFCNSLCGVSSLRRVSS